MNFLKHMRSEGTACALLLLVTLISTIESSTPLKRVKRVVGGEKTEPGDFPWLCSIRNDAIGTHACDGFIIGKYWVVTLAAGCTEFTTPAPLMIRVTAGAHNIETKEFTHQVNYMKAFYRHPQFKLLKDKKGYEYPIYDVALYQMKKPWYFNKFVKPVKLEGKGFEKSGTATIAGWGSTGETTESVAILREVTVSLVSEKKCKEIYRPQGIKIVDSMLCAGDGHAGACVKDGGSPLMCAPDDSDEEAVVCGISSFGDCLPGDYLDNPGVYTRITKVIDWIEKTIKEYGDSESDHPYGPGEDDDDDDGENKYGKDDDKPGKDDDDEEKDVYKKKGGKGDEEDGYKNKGRKDDDDDEDVHKKKGRKDDNENGYKNKGRKDDDDDEEEGAHKKKGRKDDDEDENGYKKKGREDDDEDEDGYKNKDRKDDDEDEDSYKNKDGNDEDEDEDDDDDDDEDDKNFIKKVFTDDVELFG